MSGSDRLTGGEPIKIVADSLIQTEIIQQLNSAGITDIKDIILGSIPDIARRSRLSESELRRIRHSLSKRVSLNCNLGISLSLLTPSSTLQNKLSTGSACLDSVLGGGIIYPGLVEIAGESGAGKTQLCLQLAISTQLPVEMNGVGSDRSIAYICTEDHFPSMRFKELVEARSALLYKHRQVPVDKSLFEEFSDRVYIEKADTSSGLEHYLNRWIPKLAAEKKLGIVIVDSIAGALRDEFMVNTNSLRTETLWRIAKLLRSISFNYNIPVVCTNQVTANIDNSDLSSRGPNKAALGLIWSNVLNERYVLCKREVLKFDIDESECSTTTERLFSVELSSHLPNITYSYVINAKGIKLV
ncbi:DNA repair protein XRCC3-like [Oopsacas minuta]|uniref:DNA repair protein XRCC3-like n=1 Tax=Oopsacas minuta TaxID=111878 RepID=A0AAV7KIF6_9METZ|nr:DNA repair protein XRCC3-like [Oopsacas minuta]